MFAASAAYQWLGTWEIAEHPDESEIHGQANRQA